MEEHNIKRKIKEKRSNQIKNTLINKPKYCLLENNLITNKLKKNRTQKSENDGKQIKSKFDNKLDYSKERENEELNKSIKEDNFKKYLPSSIDKKYINNSVTQNLITKILEINNPVSPRRNNSSNLTLYQKDEGIFNNIYSIKPNRISSINKKITESKEESKTSINKKESNKRRGILPKLKNSKQNILKYKKNINAVCKSGSQDFRKNSKIKLDTSNSFFGHQSENDNKYNSSISGNFRCNFKKTDILFGLYQVNESSSSRQLQVAQNIMELDLTKLQKEIYDYENTDVTDAINKLPIHKFDSDKKNNRTNKNNIRSIKIKNNKGKIIKKYTKNLKEKFRILRRVGYVYDSLDDEECEDEGNNSFYFEPNCNFILILDSMILVTSLFYLVFLPIHLSCSPFNEKNLIKDFVFIFIDIIFIIDLVSGFFKAYINFDEDLIKNTVLIIQNYLQTWFLLDFLCGVPVYSILNIINKFENNNCYESYYFDYSGKNLYHLFEMIKLLKIIKVFNANIVEKKFVHKIKKYSFFYYWGHFIKQILIFISIINLSSCLFIFSARNCYPNWIINSNMEIQNFFPIYICSYYFIITTITTVGYGDIQIFSITERTFEILFLIVGTCLYSWMLTYVSNYIKKMNEKNIKFEQQKEILDNIKFNYSLMSNDLYKKIYKLIHYKKSHKEVDKNIIIDSLPYSIRNNLLIQMYYPIISNFKFFKYFENSEFIIGIVSVLKPLIGMKGDLLINEGDFVEDIIFNKSGILSLEICIDLNNPYEFIKQYLIKYNLENVKNKKYLESNVEFKSTFRKNSLNSSYYSKNSLIFNKMSNSTVKSNNIMNFLLSIKNEEPTLGRELMIKKKFKYLKIINIRKKEHFGDVLMFLNEPSPLNLRVNSKNAEILLLNKTDVVKISSNFPNIWKKMTEKSIFNLEQIKNLIMRKLSIFCISNGIKIQSLYYKKDTKTGQNKIGYTLMSIPDPTQEEIQNQIINLNEINDKNYKDSENNSSQNYENSNETNTFVIKEVQSSEESRTNSKMTNEIKYFDDNTTSKKRELKKMSDSFKIFNQKEFVSDNDIRHKKNNKIYEQNMIENQTQSFSHSKSYRKFCKYKSTDLSNKHTKLSLKTNHTKTNTNVDNLFTNENNSSKKSKNSILSNSIKTNSIFNTNIFSFPKVTTKYQNFAEKSKMNKKLVSIPSFTFIQDYINNSANCKSEVINDEIFSNENFNIKIPDNDQKLINKNDIKSHENSISNCIELPKKLIISNKKNPSINIIKEEEMHVDSYNNLNSKNKFNNLKITSMSTLEIKSSYDNINEFTKYRFISDKSLIKKMRIFLSKECGLLYDVNSKLENMSYNTTSHNKRRKSKSTQILPKYMNNKKFYDYTNSINNLSVINDNDTNSTPPFSKELKKLGYIINKNNEKILEKEIKKSNKSFDNIKRNVTIKEENKLFRKRNSKDKNMFSYLSPENKRRKSEISSDNLLRIKTKNKLDLIMKNMEKDSQNLNNPNQFYADLFNNFYKKKVKINKSMPKIK